MRLRDFSAISNESVARLDWTRSPCEDKREGPWSFACRKSGVKTV